MPIGIRRQARMIALQTLYEYDTAHHLPSEVLQRHAEERHLQPKVVEYARETILLISMRIFKALHANGRYNKWPALIKISFDLQFMRFCSIIPYQPKLRLTKPWSLPNNSAVIPPAALLMVCLAQYLIGHNSSPLHKLKAR